MESMPLEMNDLFDNEADSDGAEVGAVPMPEARDESDHEAMSADEEQENGML